MNRIPLTLSLLCLLNCSKGEPEPTETLRSVRYVALKNESHAKRRTFSGAVRAGNQSRLSFQVPGRIASVYIKVGDRVQKGQPLASVDPMDLKIQLEEARASASQARVQSKNAEATYKRTRKLYASRNASRQELENTRSQQDAARAAYSAARQTVRKLVRQLDYAVLRAPGEGTVSQIDIEAGEMVSAGNIVGMLQVGDELEVGVEVPASFINDINVGDSVVVQVDANKAPNLKASVFEVGVAALGGTMFPVTVRLVGDTKSVRAGMAADVVFERKATKQVDPGFTVPASAVGEDREGRFVFVLEDLSDGQGTVRRKTVDVGQIDESGIRIRSGLKSGMLVVTAGVGRIQDGLRVLVPPERGEAMP